MPMVKTQQRQLESDLDNLLFAIAETVVDPTEIIKILRTIISDEDTMNGESYTTFVDASEDVIRNPLIKLRKFYLESTEEKAYIDSIHHALNRGELRVKVSEYIDRYIKDLRRFLISTNPIKGLLGERVGHELTKLLQRSTIRARTEADKRIEDEIVQLCDLIRDVEARLSTQIAGLNERVTVLDERVTQQTKLFEDALQDYRVFVARLETLTSEVKSRLDRADNRFNGLENKISENANTTEENIERLDRRLGNIETRLDAYKKVLYELKNELSDRLDTTNARLDVLQKGQEQTTTRLDALQKGQEQTTARINTLQEQTTARLDALQKGQEQTTARLDALQKGQEQTTARINTLQEQTNKRFDKLEESIGQILTLLKNQEKGKEPSPRPRSPVFS